MYLRKQPKHFFFYLVLILCVMLFGVKIVYSQEFTSSGYKVLDPVINAGGYGSSANFQLFGVISQVSNGESTASSFGDKAGFLYFSTASPVVPIMSPPGYSPLSLPLNKENIYVNGCKIADFNCDGQVD